jgi:hypothetical protein
MINAIVAFFSSFNPIVFCMVLACGALILFRRPTPTSAVHLSHRERTGSGAAWRRTQ